MWHRRSPILGWCNVLSVNSKWMRSFFPRARPCNRGAFVKQLSLIHHHGSVRGHSAADIIPEPTTCQLTAAGIGVMALLRRRGGKANTPLGRGSDGLVET